MKLKNEIINIEGTVQGVGFRPFLYNLAKKNNILGKISNSLSGVIIQIQGTESDLKSFKSEILLKKPKIAHITNIKTEKGDFQNFSDLSIIQSSFKGKSSISIPYDLSVCNECEKELVDPDNKRQNYPFINCTNCGPRFSIISKLPYDRDKTSMAEFNMCFECNKEYTNPSDRRFHAQPNACKLCGPKIWMTSSNGKTIYGNDCFKISANLLTSGKIVGIKGIGGFHLAANAIDENAIDLLRTRKNRDGKPFALMFKNIYELKKHVYISKYEEEILSGIYKPILLLRKKGSSCLAQNIAKGNKYLGVMLPYSPVHILLFNLAPAVLVMTSANISEDPICCENKDAEKKITYLADSIIYNDRKIVNALDDSVLFVKDKHKYFIRRSRGYVPLTVNLSKKFVNILATGGQLKNTICCLKENRAYVSQHIGNLDSVAAFGFFKNTINRMKSFTGLTPEAIACDLHPGYESSLWAESTDCKKIIKIQHHYAHIGSVMAENNIYENVLGLALDGTGYGTDGAVWGGEILFASPVSFKRAGHLSYIFLPGGDSAVKEPWRMAVSYLYSIFKDDLFKKDLDLFKRIDNKKIKNIVSMIKNNLNCPKTSSTGRLFDAVSSLIGICDFNSYEAQAAIELEMLVNDLEYNEKDVYDISIINNTEHKQNEGLILNQEEIIKAVFNDILNKENKETISKRFHDTLIYFFAKSCKLLQGNLKFNTVILSGGVFLNRYLSSGLNDLLKLHGFKVYLNTSVPAGDGGLSLGQAFIAANMISLNYNKM